LHALIQFFVALCLLRRAPQDLPASTALLGLVLVADLLAGALLGAVVNMPPLLAFAEGVADLVLSLGFLYLALLLLDRRARFVQTATALLGAGAVLGIVAILPLSLLPQGPPGEQSPLAGLLFLILIVWSLLVSGHILRHSFDLRLGQGVVIAVAYNLLAYILISGIYSQS
jgi:hypothetical protein